MRSSSHLVLISLVSFLSLGGCVAGRASSASLDSLDPCASDDMAETVGCNDGFACGEPAPGTPAGACTSNDIEQGSCDDGSECVAGRCLPTCAPGPQWVSTSTCPSGFRCQSLGGGWCFRDCDDLHACPGAMTCASGMCMPPF